MLSAQPKNLQYQRWRQTRDCLAGNLLFSSDDVVFGAYRFLAIKALKPAHREVTARDLLEVLHERVIYGRASERAHDRKGLSRHLLGDDNSEPRRHLGH